MNDKRVVFAVGAVVLILLGVSVFITIKNRWPKASATVEIKCETSSDVGTLKVNDSFNCSVLNKNYKFTVDSIKGNKMILKVDKSGLTDVRSDGTINLNDEKVSFEIEKGDTLKLAPQVTDSNSLVEFTWKN